MSTVLEAKSTYHLLGNHSTNFISRCYLIFFSAFSMSRCSFLFLLKLFFVWYLLCSRWTSCKLCINFFLLSLQDAFANIWYLTPFSYCSYFSPPIQATTLWKSPRSYAELLSALLLLKFLICNTLKYLEPSAFLERILRYWFAITGQAVGFSEYLIAQADGTDESKIGTSATPKDQYGRPNEAKDNR